MHQKAICWSTQFLSSVGKATMLQSVLSAIPTFAMTCFLLPVSLCRRFQSELTRFWWDDTPGERKICWVSWDTLTLPTSEGGLGFRDVQAFNQALLAKIAWRLITNPGCLFSRIILGKYCHKTSFLKITPSSAISHGWRGILHGRDLLLQHLGKSIGDGESTSLWSDSWIQPETNLKPYGPILLQDTDLMVSDFLSRETKEWNRVKIENLMPELTNHILALRPSVLGAHDAYVWPLNKSGAYTVKSGYFAASSIKPTPAPRQSLVDWNWKKNLWNPPLLPKIKIFLWKVLQQAIATCDNLQRRGVLTGAQCPSCGELETQEHLSFTATLRRRCGAMPLGLPQLPQYNRLPLRTPSNRRTTGLSCRLMV